MLEAPHLRIIWITNSVDDMDEAVMRRFSFCIDFQPLNRRQRARMWETVLRRNRVKRHFTAGRIAQMAAVYDVSAGVVDNAVKKAIDTGAGDREAFEHAVTMGLDAYMTLKSQGRPRIKEKDVDKRFTLEGLNLGGNVDALLVQIDRFGRALSESDGHSPHQMSLLFYGPPGAGKSELARYIGHRIDRPVMFRRYSDLQSKYVGEGEQKVRKAFDAAQRDGAVLVIDEMDSLLFTRDRARHSWETTFTNEVLTAIERFRSLLICTTNRIKDLDAAAMRRFTHKVEFGYLDSRGNRTFYNQLLAPLVCVPLSKAETGRIERMRRLTPGDFKTVANRHEFYTPKELNHDLLIKALKDEAQFKNLNTNRRGIGF